MAEHGGGKDIHTRSVLEQQQGDVFPPHVRRGSQSGFPVTAAPIPGGIDDGLVPAQQIANPVEIAVGIVDEVVD
jgi:hypothetical protein